MCENGQKPNPLTGRCRKERVEKKKKEVVYADTCPKFAFLGNGVYGCVVIPAIGNNYTQNINEKLAYKTSLSSRKTDIGKIFKKEKHFYTEVKNMFVVQQIDPHNIFTVKMKGAVKIPKSVLKCNSTLTRCLNVSSDKNYHQIIYENGGISVDKKFKLDFNTFIHLFAKFTKGIVVMHEKGYIHWDIKKDNVLVKKNKISLIDFGLLKKADSLFAGEYSTDNHIYYPTDAKIATKYMNRRLHLSNSSSEFKEYTEHLLRTQYLHSDMIDFLNNNKNKRYSDVFNKELALKADVYALSFILEEFLLKIVDMSSSDKQYLEKLVLKCRHKNPDKRMTSVQLYNSIVAKMRRSKHK